MSTLLVNYYRQSATKFSDGKRILTTQLADRWHDHLTSSLAKNSHRLSDAWAFLVSKTSGEASMMMHSVKGLSKRVGRGLTSLM